MTLGILIFCAILGAMAIATLIIGVSVYDIAMIRHAQLRSRKKSKPKVVLVVHYKNKEDIARIRRMVALSYKKLFVIVINQTGKSNVSRTLGSESKKLAVFSSKRTFKEATVYACRKYKHDQALVTIIGEDSEIDDVSLDEMVNYMSSHPTAKSAILNQFYLTHFNLGGLINLYQQNFIQLVRKTRSAIGLSIPTTNHDTIVYKNTAFMLNSALPTNFIATSTAFVEFNGNIWRIIIEQIQAKIDGWQHFRIVAFTRGNGLRAWVDWIFYITRQLALFALILPVGYFIYVAVSLHQPALLFVSIGIATLCILYAIWSDGQLDLRNKTLSTLQLPVLYLLIPFWVTLPIIALIAYLLEVLANVVKAKFPRRISLFARIKDVLRIV